MKIITHVVILTLSQLFVSAGRHCDYLLMKYNEFKRDCNPGRITIKSCCDLIGFPRNKAPSDVYQIRKCIPSCEKVTPFTTVTSDVYCEMGHQGGGWVVIQKNEVNSEVNFSKKWSDYEEGFGNLYSHFWYGLKSIHCLTQNYPWEMKIHYRLKNNEWHDLRYNWFSVGSASEKYPLTVGGFIGGQADVFASHPLNGMKFSTPDDDNDADGGNYAAHWKTGWWHNNCTDININTQPPRISNYDVVFTEMMIRPKDCITYY